MQNRISSPSFRYLRVFLFLPLSKLVSRPKSCRGWEFWESFFSAGTRGKRQAFQEEKTNRFPVRLQRDWVEGFQRIKTPGGGGQWPCIPWVVWFAVSKGWEKKICNSFSIKGSWFLVVCHDSHDPLPFTVEKRLDNCWSQAGWNEDVFFP